MEGHIKEHIQYHNSDHIIRHMNKYNLDYVFDYPKELLALLNWNCSKSQLYDFLKKELEEIIKKIKTKDFEIETDENYIELMKQLD